jgi:plastocyanin
MDASLVRPTARRRVPLSALARLTLAALIGLALALVYFQGLVVHQFLPDLTVFAMIIALGAGVCATGWRWTPLLGALLSFAVVAGNIEGITHDIMHPEAFHHYAFILVAVALALIGVGGGISAAVQNYRSMERRMPRVVVPMLAALAALCLGALLAGAIPRAASTGVDLQALAGLPGLSTPGYSFDQPLLKVKAGELVALRLDNPHDAPHSFDIDALNVHATAASGEQGLILFTPAQAGTYTFYCAIPGHRAAGMEGTLIVEP